MSAKAAMSRSNWPRNPFRGILRRIDYTPQRAIATAQVCAFDPRETSPDAPASVATSRRQVHRNNGVRNAARLELRDATLRPRCRCAWQGYRPPRDPGCASRGAFLVRPVQATLGPTGFGGADVPRQPQRTPAAPGAGALGTPPGWGRWARGPSG